MTVRLIVRLLDDANELLAWAEVQATMKGDACLRSGPTTFAPLAAGTVHVVSIHWPDLNVQVRIPASPGLQTEVGTLLVLAWPEEILLTFPSDPTPMPAVIVGKQAISLPPTILGITVH